MLWKLLLAIASLVTNPFRGPVDQDKPYNATPHGPQNWEEAIRAAHALQGENDDILYPIDYEPSYAGIKGNQFRWPGYPGGGKVCYELSQDVQNDKKLVGLINDAIKQYEKNTCITFVKKTNEKQCVKIIKDDGKCYSYIGRITNPQPQPLSLGGGCEFIGTVVHELGHAIGLYHEHQRSDRDTYITVYGNNVVAGAIHNFNKTDANEEEFLPNYDYTSIMHYGDYAFSKKRNVLKTMEAKDGKTKLLEPYDKAGLNNNDIAMVKKLYKCK